MRQIILPIVAALFLSGCLVILDQPDKHTTHIRIFEESGYWLLVHGYANGKLDACAPADKINATPYSGEWLLRY